MFASQAVKTALAPRVARSPNQPLAPASARSERTLHNRHLNHNSNRTRIHRRIIRTPEAVLANHQTPGARLSQTRKNLHAATEFVRVLYASLSAAQSRKPLKTAHRIVIRIGRVKAVQVKEIPATRQVQAQAKKSQTRRIPPTTRLRAITRRIHLLLPFLARIAQRGAGTTAPARDRFQLARRSGAPARMRMLIVRIASIPALRPPGVIASTLSARVVAIQAPAVLMPAEVLLATETVAETQQRHPSRDLRIMVTTQATAQGSSPRMISSRSLSNRWRAWPLPTTRMNGTARRS